MIRYLKSWWLSWRLWANMDPEQRAIIRSAFNEDDFVEVDRLRADDDE